jgi:hypothetical protein
VFSEIEKDWGGQVTKLDELLREAEEIWPAIKNAPGHGEALGHCNVVRRLVAVVKRQDQSLHAIIAPHKWQPGFIEDGPDCEEGCYCAECIAYAALKVCESIAAGKREGRDG